MSITTITITGRRGLGIVESNVTRCGATRDTHFLAAAQGGINADLQQGCSAGQTITGPARIPTGGKDVVIEADSSAPGILTIEDSPDGTTWTAVTSFPLVACVTQGYRFTPGAAQYRAKFTASASGGASRVGVFSQSRT